MNDNRIGSSANTGLESGAFSIHQIRILCILAVVSSILSVLSGFFFYYIYYKAKYFNPIALHLFRHDLIYYLITVNMLKSILSLVYPALSLSSDYYLVTAKDETCTVLGFFIHSLNSMSDYINFVFGIHIALLFFKPKLNSIYETVFEKKYFYSEHIKSIFEKIYGPKPKQSSMTNTFSNSRLNSKLDSRLNSRLNSSLNSPTNQLFNYRLNNNRYNNDKLIIYEGGLYKWRYILLTIIVILPLIQASLIYIDSQNYVSYGSFCYVSTKVWCRLLMNWFARYLILISMVIIYISIYIYITMKYNELKNIFQKNDASSLNKPNYLKKFKTKVSNFFLTILIYVNSTCKKSKQKVANPAIQINETGNSNTDLVVKQIPIESLRNSAYFQHYQQQHDSSPTSYNLEPSISPKNISFPPNAYKTLNRNSYLIENSIVFNNLNNLNNEINQLNIKNLKIRKSKNLSQIKLILIYPFAYLLILVFQFVAQIFKFPSFHHKEPFGIEVLSTMFQNIDVFIYLIAFLIKENPIGISKSINSNNDIEQSFQKFEKFNGLGGDANNQIYGDNLYDDDYQVNEINEVQLNDYIINSKLAKNNNFNSNDSAYALNFNEFLNESSKSISISNFDMLEIDLNNYAKNSDVQLDFQNTVSCDDESINLVDFLRG